MDCWPQFAITIILVAGATVASEDIESRPRERILNSKDAVDAGKSYQALLSDLGPEALATMLSDTNKGIALHAAWELHRRVIENPAHASGYTYSREELAKFTRFLKDKIKISAPEWWSTALMEMDVFPGDHHASSRTMGQWPRLVRSKIGLFVPVGADLQMTGEDLVYLENERTIVSPASAFEKLMTDSYVGVSAGERSLVAGFCSASGCKYKLVCVESDSKKLVWVADVWATGPKSGSGNDKHRVTLIERSGVVYVFGADSNGLYLEAFEFTSGRPQFRFCTCYWSNYPEAWKAVKKND